MKVKDILHKSSIVAMLAGSMIMTSCSSDEPVLIQEDTYKAEFSVNVADDILTRSNSAVGGYTNADGKNLNYIFALYEVCADNSLVLSEFISVTDSEGDGEHFSPAIMLNKKYRIVSYAYFGDPVQVAEEKKGDWLKNIILSNDKINTENEDSYYGYKDCVFTLNDLVHSLQIKRPYAKLRIIANDIPTGVSISSVTVEYQDNQFLKSLDAVVGEYATTLTDQNITITGDAYTDDDEVAYTTVLTDYIPVTAVGKDLTQFKVIVTTTDNETYTRTFSDIPLQLNAMTTLSGNFFTGATAAPMKISNSEI